MIDKDFAIVRKHLDEAGFITAINRIMLKRVKIGIARSHIDECLMLRKFRYKYRYEIIINGELIAHRSTKIKAKRFIIKRYYKNK